MPTPTLAQARNQQARQKAVAAGAVVAVRSLFRASGGRPSVQEIAQTTSRYQWAAAALSSRLVAAYVDDPMPLTAATPFAGVSSYGFSIAEPIIATIDARVPAPAEPLPDAWWDDATAFMADLEQLILSEVADAGRTASQVEFVGRPDWQNYVRMLNPPSCKRCVPLAGRIYRDLDTFERHPGDDCVMVPVDDWQSAHDAGLVTDAKDLFDRGLIRGLSQADEQAIRDGADINTVVNATRGLGAPGITAALRTEVFGRKVKATTDGTTKRAAWRKANPTRLVRLRPESIYEFAKDRDDAIRLLKLYGYIT